MLIAVESDFRKIREMPARDKSVRPTPNLFVFSVIFPLNDHAVDRREDDTVLYLWAAGCIVGVLSQRKCDVVVSTLEGAPVNGTFASPGFPGPYPNNVHCLYKFVGRENQRVRIRFTSFVLQGRYPLCENDFVDVYAELQREDQDLLDAKLTGRFCGEGDENLPSLIQSTHHILYLSFFANRHKRNAGFNGTYQFLDDTLFRDVTKVPVHDCFFSVRSENKLSGHIVSPTYPGMYPDNLSCFYKLEGKPGQRIRIRFEEFILFHGGEYCPFDYVKIFDGYTAEAPVIGTFCGRYTPSTVVYSSGEALFLQFVTGQGRINFTKPPLEQEADFSFERKGFNISYMFSEGFVNLEFITKEAEHVRGTECDQRILSNKESNGTIFSPGYPGNVPDGVVCHYYLDGLMDEQNLEKVEVFFTDFKIPGYIPECNNGYIGLQEGGEGGQMWEGQRGRVRERFCGTIRPPPLTSTGPRMVLVLNTRDAKYGGRFVALYKFVTDYGIPGDHIPGDNGRKCQFLYDSKWSKSGSTNSPRFPAKYPQNLHCVYILRPQQPHEILIFYFEVLMFPESQKDDAGCRRSDYVAIYEEVKEKNNFTMTERYCNKDTLPGPYATKNVVKIIFHSNDRESNVGFKITYQFVPVNQLRRGCGRRHEINGHGAGGKISSPQYPRKYSALTLCEWTVRASRPHNKVLMQLADLNMEGFLGSNCQHAVLKVYNDPEALHPVASLCGKSSEPPSYLSSHDTLTLRFITSPASLGAKGFDVSWTEIHTTGQCQQFMCERNKYCINQALKCDGQPNCGAQDNSDETAECPQTASFQILHIAIGTSISSFFCLILLVCGFYHRRKFRSERAHAPPPDHDHVEVRYVSAPTGYNTTERLLMERGGGVGGGGGGGVGGIGGGVGRQDQQKNDVNMKLTDSPQRKCQKMSMV
ncbi:cubilin-like [Babylonia areolata]|uniref:cubilin-like n=1 Tax=Babylonia areolata TaxID=304850 RepID=UPI003FD00580